MEKSNREFGGALPDPIIAGAGVPVANDLVGDLRMPAKFSLRDKMPQAGKQLNFSCVGWAGTYLGEFFEMRESGQFKDFSAMALFSLAKLTDGLPRTSGTYLHNAVSVPEKYGHFYEKDYPEIGFRVYEIRDEHKAEALKFKVKEVVYVDRGSQSRFEGFKEVLFRFQTPIVIGTQLYENFVPDRSGLVPMASGRAGMGHAMLMTGYDEERRVIEVLNSEGKDWGDNGYCYIPYGYPLYANGWTAIDEVPEKPQPKPEERYGKPRDLRAEQRSAVMLQESIYKSFAPHDSARAAAGRNWFDLVNAVTYGGYTFTDIVNYLYHFSRTNKYLFDLSLPRAETLG